MTEAASTSSLAYGVDIPPVAQPAPDTARRVPGQPDMWALVLFESLLFTAYFVVYMVCRVQSPDLFLHSQAQLDPRLGVFNTVVLLTSSWSMARCVQLTRSGALQAALGNVFLTIFLGIVFVASKIFEWSLEVEKGFVFSTDEFFSFYYFLTGIHLIHVLVGFVILGVVVYQLWSPRRASREIVETGATYWHMIDFLWVMIFALLYIMR
jgi:nitric oxide reductase NorE protein